MDFYYALKDLDDEQTRELIALKIANARYLAKVFPNRFIGVDCDINPDITIEGEREHLSQSMWQGFIPEDVKIIYSYVLDSNGYTVNNGCYYYITDHEYIYEFAKYIQQERIIDEIDFLTHVFKFINYYFFSFKTRNISREQMHQPPLNKYGRYIRPTMTHRFLDFKEANNAECSEFSVMAQNILSIFGFKMLFFNGSVNSIYGNGGHAFNLALINKVPCIIDFYIPSKVYKIDGKLSTYSPFLGVINGYSTTSLRRHLLKKIPYYFPDYSYLKINDSYIMISNGENRKYTVGDVECHDGPTLRKSIK